MSDYCSERETAGERPAQASPEPLSDERLAEIRLGLAIWEDCPKEMHEYAASFAVRDLLAEVDRLRAALEACQTQRDEAQELFELTQNELAARDEIVRAVAEATVVYDGRYNYSQRSRLVWAGVKTAALWRDKARALLASISTEAAEPDSGGPA